jgi:MSHA biogenesis protein MshE
MDYMAGSTAGLTGKRPDRVRIGDLLLQEKLISQEQLKSALEAQTRTGRKLGKILVESGYVSDEQIAELLARQLNLPYINLKYYNLNAVTARKLPEVQARRFRALVLEEQPEYLLLGMSDPTDLYTYDELVRLLKRELRLAVVADGALNQTIDRLYRRTDQITSLARELREDIGDIVDFGGGGLAQSGEDAPVVRLLQSVFEDATQARASDIHLEPHESGLHIRFRIDGQLHLQTEADGKISSAVVQRLKLMSGLDISEKRLPQDGRFNVLVREQHIDVRISTLPTQFGESVAMRLLNRGGRLQLLDELGLPPALLARFRQVFNKSTGTVLVVGPTGSGKTTTLYAALNELNTVERKIITVEDPVEYRLPGLNQVQVNEKIDLNFSTVLRSALRQDPDVILVGEMRDSETAQIGLRAAITGHMVFSTLHTRDAASTPLRLADMGVPRYMMAYSLQAVVAQRLLRLNCESCSRPREPEGGELTWVANAGGDPGQARFMAGEGCQRCGGSGFFRRIGIYELLEFDKDLANLANGENVGAFLAAARLKMHGMTLQDNALSLVMSGKTTAAEAMRVMSEFED